MENVSLATFPPGSEAGVAHLYFSAGRADDRAMGRLRRELKGWRGRAHANLASLRNYHLTHRRCVVVVDLYANGTLHDALHCEGGGTECHKPSHSHPSTVPSVALSCSPQ